MEFTNLDQWRNAANDRYYEVEHDAQMDVWFAWEKDTCVGAFNIENQSGDLKD
jgi:hypothetical protein